MQISVTEASVSITSSYPVCKLQPLVGDSRNIETILIWVSERLIFAILSCIVFTNRVRKMQKWKTHFSVYFSAQLCNKKKFFWMLTLLSAYCCSVKLRVWILDMYMAIFCINLKVVWVRYCIFPIIKWPSHVRWCPHTPTIFGVQESICSSQNMFLTLNTIMWEPHSAPRPPPTPIF